jgi:hypothetical protein
MTDKMTEVLMDQQISEPEIIELISECGRFGALFYRVESFEVLPSPV